MVEAGKDAARRAQIEADQMRAGQEEAQIEKEVWEASSSQNYLVPKPRSLAEAYAATYGLQLTDGVYHPGTDDADYLDAGFIGDYKKKSLWEQVNKSRVRSDELIPYPKDYNVKEPKNWVAKGEEVDPVFRIGASDPPRRPDIGSGTWKSEDATLVSRMEKQSILSSLNGVEVIWPDAVAHLRHYFENTGEPLTVNLQRIVETTPAGRDFYINQRNAALIFCSR
ncbi:hypothetical protein ACN9MY_16425 [Pseudoduganella sp. R-31]|uniref:hypothetical protein n=1 Tax=unclassified Pseudoduganella TaxID=2637179 RepID=UPI003CEADF9A